MRHSTPFRILLLSLVVLVLALTSLWLLSSRPPSEAPGKLSQTVAAPETAVADEADDLGLFPAEDTNALDLLEFKASKASKTAQPANAEAAVPRKFSAEEQAYRAEFQSQFESALAGDDSQTVELGQFINNCSTQYSSEDAVERSIEFAARRFSEGKSLPKQYAGGSMQNIENLEIFEKFQRETLSRCESSRDLFGEDFWQRLIREADGGNPAARYLYATLQLNPPESGFDFTQWDEALEHNERSTEYTWRNMQDREPLGILAMAQTLPSNSRSPYRHFSTTAVLTTAAIKCGLQSEQLDQQLDGWISHLERIQSQNPDALAQLNQASDEVRRMFCK